MRFENGASHEIVETVWKNVLQMHLVSCCMVSVFGVRKGALMFLKLDVFYWPTHQCVAQASGQCRLWFHIMMVSRIKNIIYIKSILPMIFHSLSALFLSMRVGLIMNTTFTHIWLTSHEQRWMCKDLKWEIDGATLIQILLL